jgi:hypothetical protein
MAGDDKLTPRSRWQAIVDAGRALRRMRRSLLETVAPAVRASREAVPPEAIEALAEIGRLNREAEADDSTAPTPSIIEPVRAAAVSDAPAPAPVAQAPVPSASETPPPAGLGPQTDRVLRVLPTIYRPDGKAPVGLSIPAVRNKVIAALKVERESGRAPENEKDLDDPSDDSVAKAVNHIGRTT